MTVSIVVIPHKQQRYDTVGDWQWHGEHLMISISSLGDWKMEMAVAHHELTEALLARARGITTEMVDEFDMAFEQKRPEGNTDEPGDAPDCPIRKEHFFATSIERLLCAELGVDWEEYEKKIQEL